ncbi:restriction endonuclease [Streptomyces fumigatiscleroticus]|nr:restriction endonuclease [Streptomyces fumigatiscleroticus]
MATPARRTRPSSRRRPFDLRATALFFGVVAALLCLLGFAVRLAADVVEQRPVWAVLLGLVAVAGIAVAGRRPRRRFSLTGAARRAGAALDEAARTAADALESPRGGAGSGPAEPADRSPVPGAPVPADAPRGMARTPVLGPGEPAGEATVVLDYAALEPDEFEQAIAALCERDGCVSVEVVGGAGDLGADVLAVTPDGRRAVVQCKRYGDAHRVGSQDVQRFGGTCFTVHGADVAVVVTTSDFTAPAVEYAEQCGIVCVDGQALRAWSDGTGPRPWEVPVADGAVRGPACGPDGAVRGPACGPDGAVRGPACGPDGAVRGPACGPDGAGSTRGMPGP